MSQSLPQKFPGQELEKSLINIKSILDTAKPLTEKLVVNKKIRKAIIKCLEELQVLFCNDQSDNSEFDEKIFNKYSQEIDKRQNDNTKKILLLSRLCLEDWISQEKLYSEVNKIIFDDMNDRHETISRLLCRLCNENCLTPAKRDNELNNLIYE